MALPRKVCSSAVKVFRRSKASPYACSASMRLNRVGLGIVENRGPGQWLLVSARRALVAQKILYLTSEYLRVII